MFVATMVVVIYVFGTAAIAYRYFRVFYYPDASVAPLAESGLPSATRKIDIATADGETLVAWYTPRPGAPLVIYLHGDIGNLSETLSRAKGIVDNGFAMLALEYRGYGGSTGVPEEGGLYLDADAAWLKAVELGFPASGIALLGESYGAGVALNLAARREVAAVVADGAYSSAADLVADRFWGFPARLIMRDRVRSDRFIRDIRAPLLMVHGETDVIVPIRFARALFESAHEPREFMAVPGRGHLVLADPAVMRRVGDWLWARLGGKPCDFAAAAGTC